MLWTLCKSFASYDIIFLSHLTECAAWFLFLGLKFPSIIIVHQPFSCSFSTTLELPSRVPSNFRCASSTLCFTFPSLTFFHHSFIPEDSIFFENQAETVLFRLKPYFTFLKILVLLLLSDNLGSALTVDSISWKSRQNGDLGNETYLGIVQNSR